MQSGDELLSVGKYAEAESALVLKYSQTNDDSCGFTLAMAQLAIHEAERAKTIFIALIEKSGIKYEHYYSYAGVASWMLKSYADAIDFWQAGSNCGYRDMAGGINIVLLRYFAGIRTGDESVVQKAKTLLSERLKKAWAVHWPSPIARFVLGEISDGELLAIATDPLKHYAIIGEELTQAKFYIGVQGLLSGNTKEYRTQLKSCRLPHESKFAPESYLAPFELQIAAQEERQKTGISDGSSEIS
ncbi:MAG: hypothetical protein V4719_31205 [Planctomycetota bacterium]